MRYFNLNTIYGVETIDEISPKDFESYKEFKKELNRLIKEYRIAGINIYVSQRCTNEWKHK